jgi:archaellum component FlaC
VFQQLGDLMKEYGDDLAKGVDQMRGVTAEMKDLKEVLDALNKSRKIVSRVESVGSPLWDHPEDPTR